MNRIDIVGLTLAELALILLFALMATIFPGYLMRGRQLSKFKDQQNELEKLRKENAQLHREPPASRPELRSVVRPSCKELGKAKGVLFDTIVRGRESYEVNDRSMSLRDLLLLNAAAQQTAKQFDCVQSVGVSSGAGVSGPDYVHALRRLQQYFYTTQVERSE